MEPGLVIVLIAVAGVTPVGCVWSPKRRAALLRAFTTKHQLVLAPESRADAERLLVAQRRGQTLGAVVALVATEALLMAGPRSWEGTPLGSFSIILVLGPALWLAAVLLMERLPALRWLPFAAVIVPLFLQRDVRRHLRDRLWPAPP